jgi:anhydro-N-acetylmuramic acid kinase
VSEGELWLGMISGTSRDGVDAVLAGFPAGQAQLRAALCLPYPPDLAARLERLVAGGRRPDAADLPPLDAEIARHFADAAQSLLREAGVAAASVRAIGSHGQTVWHEPDGPRPESIQLGSPALIAQRTGIRTVGDFRRADIAAGGQGAPLAPLLHRALFRPASGARAVLNLGGIANVSIIDREGDVVGFDTGPANCLLDAWIRRHRGEALDHGGAWAAGGTEDPGLLKAMLADPYFGRRSPKSTGTEYFNLSWLERLLERMEPRRPADRPAADGLPGPADVQATLAELTAATVADAVRPFAPADVLVCGGGVHNGDLLRRLRRRLPGTPLRSTAEAGLDPDWVEGMLFAWLARERVAGRPQDTRRITGAREAVLLGSVCEPGRV